MIRHDEHGFLGEIQAAKFHRRGGHRPRLAGTNDMRQQWTTALQDAPNRIFLVRRKISIAERGADHAGQSQVGTVEIPEPEVVEAEVVLLGEAFRAFPVFPNPIAKPIFQLLLLLPRGDGLWLIYAAAPILVRCVACRSPP